MIWFLPPLPSKTVLTSEFTIPNGRFYRLIEFLSDATVWPTTRRHKPLQRQHGKVRSDALDRGVFLWVPGADRVAHSKDRKRRKPRVDVLAERIAGHPRPNDVLDDAFQGSRPLADPLSARGR